MSRIPPLGPKGEGWLALQLVFMVLITVAGFLTPGPRLLPDGDPNAEVVRIAGRAILLAGLLLIVSASAILRAAGSFAAEPRPRADGTLVDSGLYRYVRHPLYAGLIVTGIGAGLARLAWIEFALTAALFVVLDLKRRREEAWLVEQYPGYAAYRARTKALVPFVY